MIRPETSTQKKLRQKNYEEGEKGTEANTPRRKPQMPKQPRNRREKREQGKESSTEEEGSKKLAARPHEQPPGAMLLTK